jgi:hypothetical protein
MSIPFDSSISNARNAYQMPDLCKTVSIPPTNSIVGILQWLCVAPRVRTARLAAFFASRDANGGYTTDSCKRAGQQSHCLHCPLPSLSSHDEQLLEAGRRLSILLRQRSEHRACRATGLVSFSHAAKVFYAQQHERTASRKLKRSRWTTSLKVF